MCGGIAVASLVPLFSRSCRDSTTPDRQNASCSSSGSFHGYSSNGYGSGYGSGGWGRSGTSSGSTAAGVSRGGFGAAGAHASAGGS
jgi:hypothetical protein